MSDRIIPALRSAFDKARAASEERGYIYGTVGRANEDGSVSVVVAGRPRYLHVTVDGEQSSTIARNRGAPRRAGLPVRMKRERGELVIVGVNELMLEAFLGGGGGSENVAFHRHVLGSGLEHPIEPLLLDMGRTRYVSGMTVHITPFHYFHAGSREYWPGGDIDLTGVKPATADTWAWVVVGVDPATNTAIAVAGAEQSTGTPLTVDQIADVAFENYIPCAAVRVRADDTALGQISRYADARIWFGLTGLLALGHLSDVTITTPANGEVLTYDGAGWVNAAIDHGSIAGLGDDDHTGYARLAGRAGGQNLRGGTAASESMTVESTSNATKGDVLLNPNGGNTGIGTPAPQGRAEVRHDQNAITRLIINNFSTGGSARTRLSFYDGATENGYLQDNKAFSLFQFTALGAYKISFAEGGSERMRLAEGRLHLGGSGDAAVSARLDLDGTDGALLLPRLTTTQRDALTAANGMVIYNTTTGALETYAGGAWGTAAHQNQTTLRVAGIVGTAVTLLPAGTVTKATRFNFVVGSSAGLASATGSASLVVPESRLLYQDTASHELTLSVTAGGALQVQRTAGTRTYELVISVVWL